MKNGQLRFAALRRVSTEQQEKSGESLRTQTTSITQIVAGLGGSIVEWYGGQESATPGHEKKEVERLIKDAHKKRFDAVIVNDPDRWSRDNTASKSGLEVFREHGIKFFTGSTERDLFNPNDILFLSISAVIGEYFARNQMDKSLKNRIERAKRNIPTGGKLPFGRVFIWDDEKTRQSGKWNIDPKKQKMIEDCARRYLAGESMPELAKEYGVNHANLHKVLTKVSGTTWELEFKSKALNIHERVEITIPKLLDEDVIKAIRKKAKINRTYNGIRVHEYLFRNMMSCAHCGQAMQGQTNHGNRRYYRSMCFKRQEPCLGPEQKAWIPAEVIEDAVMRHLFETFGNPAAVQRAIEDATPNSEKIQEAIKHLELITKELAKLKASRSRILDWSVKGTISDEDATAKLEELKEREQKLNDEQMRFEEELRHIPSAERVRNVSKMIAGQFRRYTNPRLQAKAAHANTAFDEMTYNERRALCEMVFSGELVDGRRMGVWITWDESGKKWTYRIEGHLIEANGPIEKEQLYFGAAHLQKDLVAESAWR